jgi:hypothetical protein
MNSQSAPSLPLHWEPSLLWDTAHPNHSTHVGVSKIHVETEPSCNSIKWGQGAQLSETAPLYQS